MIVGWVSARNPTNTCDDVVYLSLYQMVGRWGASHFCICICEWQRANCVYAVRAALWRIENGAILIFLQYFLFSIFNFQFSIAQEAKVRCTRSMSIEGAPYRGMFFTFQFV